MAFPLLGLAGAVFSFLKDPVMDLIKRFVPDKSKQQEFEHEFKMTVMNIAAEKGRDFTKRVIAEMEHPNWLRDAVRPIITYFAFGLYAYIKIIVVWVTTKIYLPMLSQLTTGSAADVYSRLPQIRVTLKEFMSATFSELDFYLLLTIFSFWFGSKALERVMDKVASTGGIKAFIGGSNILSSFSNSASSDSKIINVDEK